MSADRDAPLDQQISELQREISIAEKNLARQVQQNKLHPHIPPLILWRLRSAVRTLEKVKEKELAQ